MICSSQKFADQNAFAQHFWYFYCMSDDTRESIPAWSRSGFWILFEHSNISYLITSRLTLPVQILFLSITIFSPVFDISTLKYGVTAQITYQGNILVTKLCEFFLQYTIIKFRSENNRLFRVLNHSLFFTILIWKFILPMEKIKTLTRTDEKLRLNCHWHRESGNVKRWLNEIVIMTWNERGKKIPFKQTKSWTEFCLFPQLNKSRREMETLENKQHEHINKDRFEKKHKKHLL